MEGEPDILITSRPVAGCCEVPDVRLMPDTEADQMARALKALAHPIRLQIMNMLRQVEGKLCVCEIEGAFEIKQPTVSHHLKILREAGLVDAEQRGLYQYYRIKNEAVSYLRTQLRALER